MIGPRANQSAFFSGSTSTTHRCGCMLSPGGVSSERNGISPYETRSKNITAFRVPGSPLHRVMIGLRASQSALFYGSTLTTHRCGYMLSLTRVSSERNSISPSVGLRADWHRFPTARIRDRHDRPTRGPISVPRLARPEYHLATGADSTARWMPSNQRRDPIGNRTNRDRDRHQGIPRSAP